MSDFKVDFIKDFLKEYPDKEVLKDFIYTLPLTQQEKKLLEIRYCRDILTPAKVIAYEMGYSERYIKTLHKEIILKSLPLINLFFIKAFHTSLSKDK